MNRLLPLMVALAVSFPAIHVFSQTDLPEPIASADFSFDRVSDVSLGSPSKALEAQDLWASDPSPSMVPMKFTPLVTVAQAAASDSAGGSASAASSDIPSNVLNNSYLKESLRLKALAQDAFDYGDYDASAKYAAEALKNAQLSDEYVALQLKIMDADKAIAKAKAQLDWATSVGADSSFPSPFSSAKSNYDEALQDRTDKKYDEALGAAQRSIAALAWVGDAFTALQAKIKAVDEAIGKAKARLDWATSIGADKTYPSQYSTATASYGEATKDRSDKNWEGAIAAAQGVLDALASVTALAPLPAQYTVRPWATTKDCFWNIAGYPFVYGDPTQWKILYNANRSKLKNPDNPNLIFPGQVLDIPSLRGEARDGMWVSGKAYAPLPPRK